MQFYIQTYRYLAFICKLLGEKIEIVLNSISSVKYLFYRKVGKPAIVIGKRMYTEEIKTHRYCTDKGDVLVKSIKVVSSARS